MPRRSTRNGRAAKMPTTPITPRTMACTKRPNPSRLTTAAASAPMLRKTAKKATVITSAIAKATATMIQNQNAVIRGHSKPTERVSSGGFGLQPAARMALDRHRHDAGSLNDLEDVRQPDFFSPGREIDSDNGHRRIAIRTARGGHRVGRVPGPPGACAAASTDEIEDHPRPRRHRRAVLTSLHADTTTSRVFTFARRSCRASPPPLLRYPRTCAGPRGPQPRARHTGAR